VSLHRGRLVHLRDVLRDTAAAGRRELGAALEQSLVHIREKRQDVVGPLETLAPGLNQVQHFGVDLRLVNIDDTYLRHQLFVVQHLHESVHEFSRRHLVVEDLTTFLHRNIDCNQAQENDLRVVRSKLAFESPCHIHRTVNYDDQVYLRVGPRVYCRHNLGVQLSVRLGKIRVCGRIDQLIYGVALHILLLYSQ
jgi:hypothetical protein